jgi:hypothetical protein
MQIAILEVCHSRSSKASTRNLIFRATTQTEVLQDRYVPRTKLHKLLPGDKSKVNWMGRKGITWWPYFIPEHQVQAAGLVQWGCRGPGQYSTLQHNQAGFLKWTKVALAYSSRFYMLQSALQLASDKSPP